MAKSGMIDVRTPLGLNAFLWVAVLVAAIWQAVRGHASLSRKPVVWASLGVSVVMFLFNVWCLAGARHQLCTAWAFLHALAPLGMLVAVLSM